MATRLPAFFRWRRVLLVLLLAALAVLTWEAAAAIASGGGFGFLGDPTGWDIAFSVLPFNSGDPYWWAFVVGLTNTIVPGLICTLGATALGFFVGLAPLSGNHLLGGIARIYVDIVRNVPLILQATFWYGVILRLPPARRAYGLLDAVYLSNRGICIPRFSDPGLVGAGLVLVVLLIGGILAAVHPRPERRRGRGVALKRAAGLATAALAALALILIGGRLAAAAVIDWPVLRGLNFTGGFQLPPEFAALAAAIIVYRGAYVGEIFRGGFGAVSRGQIDAARALGLRPWMTLVKIRLPLALIAIIPPLSSEYITIMKVTSIGIVVGFADLFMISSNATMQTGRPLAVILIMMLLYLVLNFSIATVMNIANHRVRARGFAPDA
jgi:His/Glu/Gln/Arg/opine family amino acid ABC transporter permease subunit